MTDYNDLWEMDRGDYVTLVTELRAELEQTRNALAAVERERDEAVGKMREHAEHVNYYGDLYSRTELERRKIDEQREFYKDELAKAQTCADEMAALAWKWAYKADCQRATIRALVVAARALNNVMWGYTSSVDRYTNEPTMLARVQIENMQQAERGQKE